MEAAPEEYVYMNSENDGAAMRERIRSWIEYYNNVRVHSGNGHRIPKDAYDKLLSATYAE